MQQLQNVHGIRQYNLLRIKKCTLSSFVALIMQSEGNTNSWLLPHYNPLSYRSVFVKHFLAKEKCNKLELPQYSPGLGSADSYFLLRLNSIEATDNIGRKNCKCQNDYQECVQRLYGCVQKRTVAQRNYFEGNVA